MARLYVDVSDLLDWFRVFENPSGIQRVLVELARHGLPEQSEFVQARLTHGTWERVDHSTIMELGEYLARGNVTRQELDRKLSRATPKAAIRFARGDVLYLPGAFWIARKDSCVQWARRAGARVAFLSYDLIPIQRPELCPQSLTQAFSECLERLVPTLQAVHAISAYSGEQIRAFLDAHGAAGVPVSVHPLAHELTGSLRPDVTDRVASIVARPFAMCVGTIDRRKNQTLLLDVWHRLTKELGEECPQLVLVGGAWPQSFPDVERKIERLQGRVTIVSGATNAELNALYERCLFTLYPSLAEGWGLPVGESLARGTPCIASGATSIPEVAGDLVAYIDPTNADEACSVIREYVLSPELRAQRAARIRAEFFPRPWADFCDGIFLDLSQRFGTAPRRRTGPPELVGRPRPIGASRPQSPLPSCLCRYEDFSSNWYARFTWASHAGPVRFHRKDWEFAAITQALFERGYLAPGKRGIGFAVGTEPLAARFAAFGAEVLGTDAPPGAAPDSWAATGQHAAGREALYRPELIDRAAFDARVRFQPADMLRPEQFPSEKFDFVWSACAFEHLGGLTQGIDFVKASAKLLKPGGVAVHTTEFNVSSNTRTLESGATVLYRQRDLDRLARELAAEGYTMVGFDPDPGDTAYDNDPDVPPYYTTGRQHVKLRIGEFVATSALIIVQAPSDP